MSEHDISPEAKTELRKALSGEKSSFNMQNDIAKLLLRQVYTDDVQGMYELLELQQKQGDEDSAASTIKMLSLYDSALFDAFAISTGMILAKKGGAAQSIDRETFDGVMAQYASVVWETLLWCQDAYGEFLRAKGGHHEPHTD